jgi:hypothetical protein
MLGVVGFEVPVLVLVEVDENRHDFAVAQFTRAFSVHCTVTEPLRRRFAFGLLTEISDRAEQFQ